MAVKKLKKEPKSVRIVTIGLLQLLVGLLPLIYFSYYAFDSYDRVSMALSFLFLNVYVFVYLLGKGSLYLTKLRRLPALSFSVLIIGLLPIANGINQFYTQEVIIYNLGISYLYFLVFFLGAGMMGHRKWSLQPSLLIAPAIFAISTIQLSPFYFPQIKYKLTSYLTALEIPVSLFTVQSKEMGYLLVFAFFYFSYILLFNRKHIKQQFSDKENILARKKYGRQKVKSSHKTHMRVAIDV